MNDMDSASQPPHYVLVSHVPLLNNTVPPPPTCFSHPIIEYHYADDSPHRLLPQTPGELVLVLDYDPADGTSPTTKSLTTELAVTGLKVTEAPGASAVDEGTSKNTGMYVLETTVLPEETLDGDESQTPQAILTRFKQRNAVLRRVLDYPQQLQELSQEQIPAPGLLSIDTQPTEIV